MLTIDYYTGNWQEALRPTPPRIGSHVRIHESADAREYDDFDRCLRQNKLMAETFIRWYPLLKMTEYKIEKRENYGY